ncbi:DUF3558 domain-containing protein [Saccharopolyspora hirsuta]|uniref:DUF3558 domain-containing protein n=1 Tax=Saccharopolyspora hirsuta TaxID=1837 RepID=A0A5M7BRT0_SACHI|nr:DUF3558 domain-containing protein [Saccharopolyspora hirsuta]KAA5832103.1 DUF3558 domain-containing protein [Saccharopolyspora hirsuta]
MVCEGENLRKGLAASAVLASVLLAGCSGGSGEPVPTGTGTPQEQVTSEAPATQSARTAPAKSLEIGDRCAIISEAQVKELGADQAPRERESNGKPGCSYGRGTAGVDATVFVAVDKSSTMQKYAESATKEPEKSEIAGYPAVQVSLVETNCTLVLDVSDQGSLFVNTVVSSADPNPCELSKRFAEAALQNLPNA